MSTPNPKRALFAQFAAVAKSLAHSHRLELLEQLAQGDRSVEVLADRTGLSIANASQHLQHLRRAGLVTKQTRRQVRLLLACRRRRSRLASRAAQDRRAEYR